MDETQEWRAAARADVARWAREVLGDSDTVIVDLETSDHPKASPEVIEVGVISGQGEVLLQALYSPTDRITRGASELHGLTDEDVEGQPDFWNDNGYEDLVGILERKRMVMHQWWGGARWECAQDAYQRWLGVTCPSAPPGSLHRAVPGCYATLGLTHLMASTNPDRHISSDGDGKSATLGRQASATQEDWIHDLLFDLRRIYPTKTARCKRVSEITGEAVGRLSSLSPGQASGVIDELKAEVQRVRILEWTDPISPENKTALDARLTGLDVPRGTPRYRLLERILTELGIPDRKISSSGELTEGEYGPVMDRLRDNLVSWHEANQLAHRGSRPVGQDGSVGGRLKELRKVAVLWRPIR